MVSLPEGSDFDYTKAFVRSTGEFHSPKPGYFRCTGVPKVVVPICEPYVRLLLGAWGFPYPQAVYIQLI